MKRILLTGANGLLGQKLVEKIAANPDWDFLATGRGEARFVTPDVRYAQMDIENANDVQRVFAEFKPEIVIHSAAMTNVDACELDQEASYKANVVATENLLKAAEEHNSFFLHLSTDFIFSGEDGPYDEKAEADPVNYYGECKLEAEKKVMQAKLRWAIARTVLVYGVTPGMSRSNIILWVKKSLEEGKDIQVVDDQLRSPTLAEDLADGCLLIAEKEAEGIWNISGKEMLTPYQMAMQTAEYFNLDASHINRTDSTIFKQPAKRPPKTGFLIDKAVRELNYRPHSFKEGIALLARQLTNVADKT